jgi:aerobic-type carbon monoxide dehydrogenase small subunit (CoxS/CutS family)
MQIVHMTVNGQPRELAVEEGETLTDTLRGRLGLTSVKKGCEAGECGACTVLIDGRAHNSCIYLTVWAEGRSILTVEGLCGPNGELDPIQQAFVEEAAIQCGFCTPGLILTGVELARSGKRYTRDELREAISGHLCRCTGYENILNALERVVGKEPCGAARHTGTAERKDKA